MEIIGQLIHRNREIVQSFSANQALVTDHQLAMSIATNVQ